MINKKRFFSEPFQKNKNSWLVQLRIVLKDFCVLSPFCSRKNKRLMTRVGVRHTVTSKIEQSNPAQLTFFCAQRRSLRAPEIPTVDQERNLTREKKKYSPRNRFFSRFREKSLSKGESRLKGFPFGRQDRMMYGWISTIHLSWDCLIGKYNVAVPRPCVKWWANRTVRFPIVGSWALLGVYVYQRRTVN